MTYLELYEKATKQLEKSEITLGEYEEMIKPLDREIIITCRDCKYCRFELVEGIPYYWCDKDNCATSEDFYCGNAERIE